VGSALVPPGKNATWLYRDAPFVVLAHGIGPDPHFIYANKAAEGCFGYAWEEFLTLPSRHSGAHCEVGAALYHRARRGLGADRLAGHAARPGRTLLFLAGRLNFGSGHGPA
jgi:hypothetical protein